MMLQPPIPFGHETGRNSPQRLVRESTQFEPGDRVVALNSAPCDVCFFCTHGQQNLCEALQFQQRRLCRVHPDPGTESSRRIPCASPTTSAFEHAALTEPLACVVRGLEETQAQPGDTMIVLGAGPIGLMFMHVAELAGIDVIAVVKARGPGCLGASVRRAPGPSRVSEERDIVAAARALTPNDRGADSVIEAVATPVTWGLGR